MSLAFGLDPKELHQSGWGLLLPADADPSQVKNILAALQPLLELRQEQAGKVFRLLKDKSGVRKGETPERFQIRSGATPGNVDPKILPYYLLIAASPEQISFEFQAELGVSHAVGRIWFDDRADFQAYANSVRRAEEGRSARPAELAFFSSRNPDDRTTASIDGQLIAPLAERLRSGWQERSWKINLWNGTQATRASLIQSLADRAPRILFAAGHGLVYPNEDAGQRAGQGGLVCADWPGPSAWKDAIPSEMCFQAQDVEQTFDLCGMLFIQYSSFSLGTPLNENFVRPQASEPARLAGQPFVARLPQRLLSLPEGHGALAAVGWVDRLWSYNSSEHASREQAVIVDMLNRLADEYPLGAALETFQTRYAELSSEIVGVFQELQYTSVDAAPLDLPDLWAAYNNARGLALFGDPAVRLPVTVTPEVEDQAKGVFEIFTQQGAQPGPAVEAKASELMIQLIRLGVADYLVEMRLTQQAGESFLERATERGVARLDFDALRAAALDSQEYGTRLFTSVFADTSLQTYYRQAMSFVREIGSGPRLRLSIDRSALELHELGWERLFDPEQQAFLALDSELSFTRFLYSTDWSRYELRPRGKLRALTLVANPSILKQGLTLLGETLNEFDVAAEVERAHAALGKVQTLDVLESRVKEPGRASLANLQAHLRKGYDILYLVCHGVMLPDDPLDPNSPRKPYLILENEKGDYYERVEAQRLVDYLRNLPAALRPRLAVLAIRQSAGLGPRLVEIGVPAVVALQGNVKMRTIEQFMPVFFETLLEDGRVDLAMAIARSQVYTANRPDWWVPVLYLRLREGRLWYQSGFEPR